MNQNQLPAVRKTKYRGFSLKERMIPSLLLSLAIPFTLFFFGPFEVYCNNIQEFGFVFADFGWISLGMAALTAAVLFSLFLLLSGRAFDVVFGLFFGMGFMLFLQGNYLNLGLNAVDGDGVGVSGYSTGALVVNLILWILLLAASVTVFLLLRKKREILRLASTVALVTVIGVQMMTFGVLSLTTDVWVPMNERHEVTVESGSGNGTADEDEKELVTVEAPSGDGYLPGILTNANLNKVSSKGNVIWIVVDRFDINYYNKILASEPDFFENLDGFTLYDNQITKYARTFPSIAYMLTGVENDYSTTRTEYFEKAYTGGTFLSDLKENGYNVNIYTEKYYAYEDATMLEGVVNNLSTSTLYTVINRAGLWGDMLRLTLFRYLPIFAKGWVGTINSSDFNSYVEYESNKPLFDSGMKDVYTWLTEAPFTAQSEGKNFTFLHINGCHMPNSYDEDFNMVLSDSKKWDSDLAMRVSFKVVNYYLNELKRLGVYEDSTIIITGDHAAAISDTKDLSGSRVTALLVKKKGDSGTPLTVNSAPVEQSQLRATILASEGITTENDYGPSIFEIQEGDDVKRYYHFQKTVTGGDDELVVYEVVGDAKDFENWKIVDRINVGNLYK